ncbi:MAG: hypothetical protein DYG94_08440 [Leptolyngbya sp. PLA3]|nr:MAG: hypothetical protein EDM82_07050 [Cyanobacteria bacterium CYA]MCE7968759.1 hypothetical protein [Leptolyngbya sp. PL-A3]
MSVVLPAAAAQTSGAGPDAVTQAAAREIQRLALAELRMQPSPTPDDYLISYYTLRLAQQLTPDDADLSRKVAAAAWATGDSDLLIDATRQVVRLDPDDTVAQLRLIISGIARQQTVEQRLAAYERFLGPAGERLRPEVRSRLALDAALLLRERGDAQGFVRMLRQAIDLDGSNKSAVQLALTYFTSEVDDPVGRFEMQLNVLYADPIDPQVHYSIARELLAQGAMTSGRRFFSHASQLFNLGGKLPPSFGTETLSLRFQTEGPAIVRDALNAELSVMRSNAQLRRQAAIERDLPLDDFVDPAEVRLDVELDKMRILAALALGDTETVEAALTDLEKSVVYASMQLESEKTRPAGYTADQASSLIISMFIELQLYRLWCDSRRETVDADIAAMTAKAPGVARLLEPLDPWLRLRDGEYEQAIARVDQMQGGPGRVGEIARGLALEKLGRTKEAVQVLLESTRYAPLSAAAAWARHHALALDPSSTPMTALGRSLDSMAAAVPRYIDDMVYDPKTFMDLQVDAGPRSRDPMQPFYVTVRLRNLAPIPLGVGSDRPINSRLLLQPHRDNNVGFFFGELFPEVVELNRRFRLDPRETIEARIPVDLGASGVILSLNSLNNHRIRWRVLQGFVIGALQSFRPGPLCLSVESSPVEIVRLPQHRLTAEQASVLIQSGSPEELLGGVMLARAIMLAWPVRTAERPQAGIELFARALTTRLESALPAERAYLLAAVPPSEMEVNLMEFDHAAQAMLEDSNFRARPHAAVVESLVLLTRVTDPGSPLLAQAINAPWPEVAQLAGLIKTRLEEARPCVARATDVRAMFPPALKASEGGR